MQEHQRKLLWRMAVGLILFAVAWITVQGIRGAREREVIRERELLERYAAAEEANELYAQSLIASCGILGINEAFLEDVFRCVIAQNFRPLGADRLEDAIENYQLPVLCRARKLVDFTVAEFTECLKEVPGLQLEVVVPELNNQFLVPLPNPR